MVAAFKGPPSAGVGCVSALESAPHSPRAPEGGVCAHGVLHE